jgi:hypothetical protein
MQQLDHQNAIIKNFERDESIPPNYYQWSLCDIDSAYDDLFNRMFSRSMKFQLEPLSYFNYKRIGRFSSIYDGSIVYPQQQHFGTSQMNKPHPMRDSIPCEERFRWMPVRTSSMIGRRAHLPLDIFNMTTKKSLEI